jgi:hypothetical protein
MTELLGDVDTERVTLAPENECGYACKRPGGREAVEVEVG